MVSPLVLSDLLFFHDLTDKKISLLSSCLRWLDSGGDRNGRRAILILQNQATRFLGVTRGQSSVAGSVWILASERGRPLFRLLEVIFLIILRLQA